MPDNLKVEEGTHAFLVGHAIGTQNYVCAPSGTGVAYVLFTPEATLFNDDGDQLITHFFSPNPERNPPDPNTNPAVVADGAIRATWVSSKDGSTVWAKLHIGEKGAGSFTPDKTAVAWLLLDTVGAQDGLTGGDILSKTTQVQRLSTTGGVPDRSMAVTRRQTSVIRRFRITRPTTSSTRTNKSDADDSNSDLCTRAVENRTAQPSGSPYQSLVLSSR